VEQVKGEIEQVEGKVGENLEKHRRAEKD